MECLKYGLFSVNRGVPLIESKVHATIQGFIANVETKLMYVNEFSNSIETKFLFPVDDRSALYKLEAVINGRHIIAECQDKQKANKTYEEAVSTGHIAMHLSEKKNSGDVIECKLGNLAPGETAQLMMSYVVELSVEPDNSFKFILPTVLFPRYTPDITESEDDEMMESENPEKMTFTASVQGHHRIKTITSDRKDFTVQIDKDQLSASMVLTKALSSEKDFAFYIAYDNIEKPEAILELGGPNKDGLLKENILMLNFFPDLKFQGKDNKREFVFIMDRSGSMMGSRIKQSKDTLLLFLKSLPIGCFFNIVSFGSSFSMLFNKSKQYNKQNLTAAIQHQKEMEADMGGTEILLPLAAIFRQRCIRGCSRQIFLLTDGAVNNTSEVVQLVGENVHNSRVFTFGIGDGASTSLIKNVAGAGHGTATFIQDKGDNMKAKVIKALEYSMGNCMTDISLDWNLPSGYNVTNIPAVPPNIFNGDKVVLFALIHSKEAKVNLSGSLNVTGTIKGKKSTQTIAIQIPSSSHPDQPIHRVAAKHLIKELELEDIGDWGRGGINKEKITLVSQAANIISKYTAFVGVDLETKVPVWKKKVPNRKRSRTSADGPASQIQVNVRTLTGETHIIETTTDSLVEDIKFAINEEMGVPMDQQRLIFAGRQLEDQRTMEDYGLDDDSTLHLVLRLRGGGHECTLESFLKAYKDCHGDVMMRLVELQDFDGSWEYSKDLTEYVGVKDELLTGCKTYKLNVWCTAFVVIYLQRLFGDRCDEWKMIESKAISWLESQDRAGKSVQELLDEARQVEWKTRY